ncbi:MAG: glucohydrolase, partial [Oscillospiraceae bacterium]|nr:glucohydrolase [Oscillospiraceae bacterium]
MKKQWWHGKIAYQIYPKSFCDANGDGIGDLRGILSKLDYLKDLGVDIVWISPIYRSPFVDQGYDIADYYAIDPVFGTMEEFDLLLAEAKKRGIGIVMDLVINHCSDQHEWFKAAVADPTGPAAQRFYFRKGRNGQPPSNYRSYFGGPAWDKVPGQEDLWYLHLFAKEQPDLNWYSEPLREELFRMVNWWLDKGLAGFRVDAIINIQKQLDFPCYPADGPDGLVSCTRMVEESRDAAFFLSQLRDKAFAPHEAFTVGEVFSLRSEQVQEFIGEGGYFSTMFDFSAALLNELEPGRYERKPFDFKQWRSTLFNSQAACPRDGFLANIIENHDEPRGASTFLPEH